MVRISSFGICLKLSKVGHGGRWRGEDSYEQEIERVKDTEKDLETKKKKDTGKGFTSPTGR